MVHRIMKPFDEALRAEPPGPVAVIVVKNSCAFGSVPNNVCSSTVIVVVADQGLPRLDERYGRPVDVFVPAAHTCNV